MDTNGMDTNALVAVGADAVLSVATRHGRMTTVGSAGENPSSGLFRPRDNSHYRAANGRTQTGASDPFHRPHRAGKPMSATV